MKRLMLTVVAVGAAVAASAETYDRKLEFVETTGTQWFDTGIHFNYRRSVFRATFRLLEQPTDKVSICGATDVKDSREGYYDGMRLATTVFAGKSGNDDYIFPSFTGGEDSGYYWWHEKPESSVEVESDIAVAYVNGQRSGYNSETGKGYCDGGKLDQEMTATFYLGAVNNAGEGLYTPEGSLPKTHWYGLQIWTDGVLVRDYIPVLKNDVAGFFDLVTETFHSSQGADAFVAPVEVSWSGAGTEGDVADAANWEGNVAPSTVHQVAVFPAGTSVKSTASTCAAFFSALGGIRLDGADAKLHIANVSSAIDFYAPVGGTGTFVVQSATGGSDCNFAICSASPNFYGTYLMTNAYVTIRAPSAVGVKGRSTAIYDALLGNERLSFSYQTGFHADLHARHPGAFTFGNVLSEFDADWTFDGDCDYTFHNNDCRSMDYGFRFNGKITGCGEDRHAVSFTSGCYAFGGEEKDFGSRQAWFRWCFGVCFNAKMDFDTLWKNDNMSVQANVVQGCEYDQNWTFGVTNAFPTNAFVLLCRNADVSDQPYSHIDFCGYDQRLGTLGIGGSAFDPSTTWNSKLVLTSEQPATLTVYGDVRNDGTAQVFPGKLTGAVSFRLNSLASVMQHAYDWPDAQVPGGAKFNNPDSDTTGSLIAERGMIEVMSTAAFPNLASLVVSGEGKIDVKTASVGTANAAFQVRVLGTDARIGVADGVTLQADVFELPGGKFLLAGKYSGTAGEGVTYSPYLTGAGVVQVKRYGGKRGFVMVVR